MADKTEKHETGLCPNCHTLWNTHAEPELEACRAAMALSQPYIELRIRIPKEAKYTPDELDQLGEALKDLLYNEFDDMGSPLYGVGEDVTYEVKL